MANTSKTQVFLSKFNRLGSQNMRQIFNLRGKYLKKRSQVFDVSRATTDFNETKTGFLYVESSLFVLNSYHKTVGSIFFLLSPFLFHFTLTKGQGGQDDFFLFNPFSPSSCLSLFQDSGATAAQDATNEDPLHSRSKHQKVRRILFR